MPKITTTTTVSGGGDGGGGVATGLVFILGAVVLAPVVGVYIAALTSLLTTVVLCIVVLALTGGALYWLREFTRERRLRLEQDLLIAQHALGRPIHRPAIPARQDQYRALPPAQARIIDAHVINRRELER